MKRSRFVAGTTFSVRLPAARTAMVFTGALSAAMLGALGIVRTPCAAADEAAPAAEARGSSGASQLSEDGAELYRARDYRHAVEKFILAYASDPDPNLLYNIARCYEALGETDVAIEKYQAFLATPGADEHGKQRARDALAKLHGSDETPPEPGKTQSSSAQTGRAQSDATAQSAREPRDSSGPRRHTPAAQPVALTSSVHQSPAQPSLLPWLTLGAGAASAGVGGILYMLGTANHSKVTGTAGYNNPTRTAAITEGSARELVDSGTRKKTAGGVGLGVGGALLATSIVLFATGNSGKNKERGVALRVSPATSGGSVALRGSF